MSETNEKFERLLDMEQEARIMRTMAEFSKPTAGKLLESEAARSRLSKALDDLTAEEFKAFGEYRKQKLGY